MLSKEGMVIIILSCLIFNIFCNFPPFIKFYCAYYRSEKYTFIRRIYHSLSLSPFFIPSGHPKFWKNNFPFLILLKSSTLVDHTMKNALPFVSAL